MPGHYSQSWQRPGSLRFDSAKSLWTWRAILPLMSGSGVADLRSGRLPPGSETDLRPSVSRPANRNKTHARTAGSHYFAVAYIREFEPVLLSTYAEIEWQQKCAYSFLHAQTLFSIDTSNEIRSIRLLNIFQTITKFIDCLNFSWTHFSKEMNNVQMYFLT